MNMLEVKTEHTNFDFADKQELNSCCIAHEKSDVYYIHRLFAVWQTDGRLIERCNCGYSATPSPQTLQTALDNCTIARNQYVEAADKASGKRQQEMLEAVAQQTRQIEWLTEQLKTVSVRVPIETCEDTEVADSELAAITSELSLSELAVAINSSHQRCQEAYKSSLLEACRAGEFLLIAKTKVKELSSGRWLVWLSENCPDIPKRTAQAYMQVAREWEQIEKSATVALFGFKDALKYLAASKKSTVSEESTQFHSSADRNTFDSGSPEQTSEKIMDAQQGESHLPQSTECGCDKEDIETADHAEKRQGLVLEPKSKDKQLLPNIEPNPGMPSTELPSIPAALANTSVIATATNPAVLTTELTIGVLSNHDYFNESQVEAMGNVILKKINPKQWGKAINDLSDEEFSVVLAEIQPRVKQMGVLQ